ncbi:MAG: hypothetical protein HYU41_08915 [Candidatus Rokubacteria bacterium]|nr:hypothetical protein [Candidatus Rokubacteria bacterium]
MVRTLVLATSLALTACTTFDLDDVWSKSGATTHQTTHDDWECRREAYDRIYPSPDMYVGGVTDAVRVVLDDQRSDTSFADCMKARGYAKTAG